MAISPKTATWIIVVLTIGGLVGSFSFFGGRIQKQTAPQSGESQTQTLKTVSYQGQNGKTVLELLQKDHQVEIETVDYGAFVKSIDGTSNTQAAFWRYYLNGQTGDTSPDKKMTTDTDSIEWRLEGTR